MKRQPNELGRNSRAVIRFLDSLKKLDKGNLHTGVTLENGATVRIQLEEKAEYKYHFALTINDNRIIMAAYSLQEQGQNVVFVSKDFAARVKAEAVGLEAEDYENLKVSYETVYKGLSKVDLPNVISISSIKMEPSPFPTSFKA